MSFPEIKAAIDQTAEAFTAFKKTNDQRVAELLDRIETLEAKGMNPGRTGPADKKAMGDNTDALYTAEGAAVPILRKGADYRAHYARQIAEGDDLEGLSLADFVRGVAKMKTSPAAQKALSVGTGTAGGYAVPTVVMPNILEALTPASTMMQAGAGIVDVSAEPAGKAWNFAAVNAIPTAAWRSEGGAVSESDPTFREVPTTPRSLSFYFKVSRELLSDAANMDSALRQAIAQAFAKELDRTGLRGSGTPPEPTGILNTSNVGSVTNGAAGAAQAGLRWSNLLSAVQTIMGYDAMPNAAIMAPRSAVGYAALADTTNQPLQKPDLLRNLQFLVSSQIPVNLTVTTSSDCTEVYVGDFAQVIFVMRERPVIALANELFALNGQVGFVCHVRADVAVLYPRAFAVITGIRA